MELKDAYARLNKSQPDFGRFYGAAEGYPIGVGIVLTGVAFPFYSRERSEFAVGVGRAYVVSHECDIDPTNDRPFNDTALVCPIIPLEILLGRYLAGRSADQTKNFIDALSRRTVDRAAYIPAIHETLPYGGVLHLNSMTHTNVIEFTNGNVRKACIVSGFGLRYVDAAISHALLKRPKASPPPMAAGSGYWKESNLPTARQAAKSLMSALLSKRW